MSPTSKEILAASGGWVAVVLNIFPGIGSGYLYQRRWKAYWITSATAITWFSVAAFLAQSVQSSEDSQNQLVGLIGFFVLSLFTSIDAGLAVKNARQT